MDGAREEKTDSRRENTHLLSILSHRLRSRLGDVLLSPSMDDVLVGFGPALTRSEGGFAEGEEREFVSSLQQARSMSFEFDSFLSRC